MNLYLRKIKDLSTAAEDKSTWNLYLRNLKDFFYGSRRPERRWGSRDRLRGKEALCLHRVAHMSPYIITQEVHIKWNDRSIESCTRSRGHTHDPHTQVNRGQGRVGTHTIRTHNPLVNPRAIIPRAVTHHSKWKYPVILKGNMSEGDPPSDRARVTGAINCVNSMLLTRINFLTNDLLEGAHFLVKSNP